MSRPKAVGGLNTCQRLHVDRPARVLSVLVAAGLWESYSNVGSGYHQARRLTSPIRASKLNFNHERGADPCVN